MTGLRAFVTVFMGALAIRRPNPTRDFIILNKSRIGPPRGGVARSTLFQNFSPMFVPSRMLVPGHKERRKGRKKKNETKERTTERMKGRAKKGSYYVRTSCEGRQRRPIE